ncbi:MAG TPA: glycosyltransferase family 4 protein [Cyclobacteriaceae bacterium]|nr:glycosyltransferase family 4 protein [Cyclobacteriaceae bacterium]
MRKICHVTTAHPRYDTRIFLKECCSLASRYETHFIVSDGKGDEIRNNISIHDAGVNTRNRLVRFVKTVRAVYMKALRLDCEVYHFHDPDFILAAVMLRRKGKRIIYDIHEDVPRDILSKDYLGILKKTTSLLFEVVENWSARRFDGLIAATPFITERFIKINQNTWNVNNYPLLGERLLSNNSEKERSHIAYVGSVMRIKGVSQVIEAITNLPVVLELAGDFESDDFRQELTSKPGWSKVKYHGNLNRKNVGELLQRCVAGVVTFNPEPNYVDSLPIKMFEYMSFGLPVICSNFQTWRAIVEKNNCGVCVDPMDPEDISDKIMTILNDPDAATAMGKNGIRAINEVYNWGIEEKKLYGIYSLILT